MNLTNKEPRKGTIAYYAAQKRKEKENSPEEIKKTEKIGNNDHKIGNAKVTHESLSEAAIVSINALLAEGKMSQYRPPFKANGLWVDDSRGASVLQANDHGTPKEIAAALNAFFGKKTVKEAEEQEDYKVIRARNKKIVQAAHKKLIDQGYVYQGSEGRSAPMDDDITSHNYLSKDGSHIKSMEYSAYGMGWKDGPNISYATKKLNKKLHADLTEAVKLHADLREASDLNNVTIGGMKDKKAGRKDGEQCEEGDEVEITGQVNFKGDRGEIVRFGKDKRFVVVKLHNGGEHAFHSSDVTAVDGDDEDDEKEDEDTFYVAFYDEDEERSWIGEVTKAGGGKWHEKTFKGKPDYRWGQSYMSYLTPHDIMSWINKDYGRNLEIEGPYFDPDEAIEHVKHNWGTLEEAAKQAFAKAFIKSNDDATKMLHKKLQDKKQHIKDIQIKITDLAGEKKGIAALEKTLAGLQKEIDSIHKKIKESVDMNEAQAYTDFEDWKAAVLHSYPAQAKKIKFKGRMEGNKDTISAEVPGEDRSYGVWDQDEEKGVVLSEGAASAIVAAAKKIGKWLLQPVTAVSDKNIEEYVNAVEELKAMKEQRMWAGLMARLTDEQLDRAKLLSNPAVKKAAKAEIANRLKGVFEAVKDMIEAHGIKGMSRTPWRRTFKDEDAMIAWAEKFDAEIYGQRETDYAAQMKKEKGVKEGVVDSVKGFVKHQSNMAKANSRGWATFGKGFRAALADRYETDPEEKAKNEKTVKQSVRDANRYRDFADGGKGFNSTKRTTAEKEWDDKVDAVKGKVKGAVDSVKKVFTKEGAANDRLQARARELLPVLKGPFKKKESVVAQCAELAAKYWNDAGLQKAHDIDDYIKSEMKKRGITEGVQAAIAEGKEENIAKLRKDYKNAKGWIDMATNERERRTHQATVQKIWNHAKTQYKIDLDRKDGKLDEGTLKPATRTHKSGCGYNYGHDCDCGGTWTHGNDCGYRYGHDCDCDLDKKKSAEKPGSKDKSFGDTYEGFSPFKPNAKVKIVSGPKDCIGKEGTIGEVVTTNGQKSYTVDYDHDFNSDKPNFGAKSVRLQPKDIKLIRDKKLKEAKEEQLEVISKGAEKVLHTGTLEACKDFMRKHRSLKLDLRYKESGRLASYVL